MEPPDVAVAQVAEAEPDADILPMSETMLLQKPFPKTIGIGSQVFMTGMFSLVSGNPFDRDSAQTIPVEPILRTGNIAMIPKESDTNELWICRRLPDRGEIIRRTQRLARVRKRDSSISSQIP